MKFSGQFVNSIKVYDIKGALRYQAFDISQNEFTLDISSFSNGVYFISAEFDNQVITKKLILQK